MPVRGWLRDVVPGAAHGPAPAAWRANRLLDGGLDTVGELLARTPGARGLSVLAVGGGDPAWGDAPPPADPADDRLVDELLRVRLAPGADVVADADGVVRVTVTLRFEEATVLREVALAAAGATRRPGTGRLFNVVRHAPLEVGTGQELRRELKLVPAPGIEPGLARTIARLLAGGGHGVESLAVGAGRRADGAPELGDERHRRRLRRAELHYDRPERTVRVDARLEADEGPAVVKEAGLFSGDGELLMYAAQDAVERPVARRLRESLAIVLYGGDDIEVPDLSGLDFEQARARLADAGLAAGAPREEVADGADPGIVIDQDPVAGARARERELVTIVLAAGATARVPDLVELELAAAREELAAAGLRVAEGRPAERESDARPRTVLASEPRAGTTVPLGSPVKLVVAVPRRVRVPDVRGRTPAAAAPVLRLAGLELAPGRPEVEQSGGTPGTIVSQEPGGGTSAAAGSEVAVRVASVWTVEVPGLAGLDVTAAAGRLRDAAAPRLAQLGRPPEPPGLAVGVVTSRPDAAAAAGAVLEQTPAAGRQAPLYGLVDLVVAAPVPSAVPPLVGLTRTAAEAAVAAAGYRLVTRGWRGLVRPDEPANAALVAEQHPGAGNEWERGREITVTLQAPAARRLPDLRELDLAAAREALRARELPEPEVRPVGADAAPGTVVEQDPEPGTIVAADTVVALGVAEGIPSFLGSPVDEARQRAKALGLEFQVAGKEEHDGPADVVVRQDPEPGAAGDRVSVVVSVAARSEVPGLTGMSLEEARAAAREAGFELEIAETVSVRDVEVETVRKQDPRKGASAPPGSTIRVVVAVPVGLTVVTVPDVVGRHVDEAAALLRRAGLRLEEDERVEVAEPPGTVLRQDPEPEYEVEAGATVRVTCSAGEVGTVAVPALLGLDAAAARLLIRRTGLAGIAREVPTIQAAGTVVDQVPQQGVQVPRGSTVTIGVAVPPLRPRDDVIIGRPPLNRPPIDIGGRPPIDPGRPPIDPGRPPI